MKYEWIKANQKKIIILFVAIVGLVVMKYGSTYFGGSPYVKADGRVVGLQRSTLEKEESFPLILEVLDGDEKRKFSVNISLEGNPSGSKNGSKEKDTTQAVDHVELAVDDLIEQLEEKTDVIVKLPARLDNGSPILWKAPSGGSPLLLLLLFPLLVYFMYRSEDEKIKKEQKRLQDDVRKALPAFNDQLLLLMNSGLIFQDAFFRVGENYRLRDNQSAFGLLILEIMKEAEQSGRSVISILRDQAKTIGVREFSRMTNIIADNQFKGVDLRTKLASESQMLWDGRKAYSLQKSKEIETKLAFPLAVLLIVLMVVAGVPAMMKM